MEREGVTRGACPQPLWKFQVKTHHGHTVLFADEIGFTQSKCDGREMLRRKFCWTDRGPDSSRFRRRSLGTTLFISLKHSRAHRNHTHNCVPFWVGFGPCTEVGWHLVLSIQLFHWPFCSQPINKGLGQCVEKINWKTCWLIQSERQRRKDIYSLSAPALEWKEKQWGMESKRPTQLFTQHPIRKLHTQSVPLINSL